MLNIQGLMKQAQIMQKKMQETQARLADEVREGSSGNGVVKITLNGRSEMTKIVLDKSVVDPEDTEMLEDLILAAYNDAHKKIESMQEEGMKEATGGANFGGLKIPF